MRSERGFALLGVMLVVGLLTVVVLELTVAMRLEASAGRSFKDQLVASHLAEAAVQQALQEVASQAPIPAVDERGGVVFHRVVPGSALPARLPLLRRERVPFGAGEFSYRITDEQARLNLNTAPPTRLGRLLQALGLDRRERDVVVDSLQDWKDADDLAHANGAESEDYYLRLPVPHHARNAPLQDVAELRQIRGVTRELYEGREGRPGLAELTTVFGRDAVNINTAPAPVLAALGLSEAEITDVVQTRVRAPYVVLPGRFAARGLGVGSQIFRVEAEGWVGGVRQARIVAIVQRQAPRPADAAPDDLAAFGLVLLTWREGEDR